MRGVVKGPCGEKVGHAYSVEAVEAAVPGHGALPGVRLRWLVSKDDGAPTYAMRLFELEPGARIPGHRHPWEHEIYVLRGSVEVCVERRCYQLSRDDFVYIPPNTLHSYRAGAEGAAFLCIIPHGPSVPEEEPGCGSKAG